jgi:hypothetical protein
MRTETVKIFENGVWKEVKKVSSVLDDKTYSVVSNVLGNNDRDFKDKEVIVFEQIKGFHVRVYYDGKTVFGGSRNSIFKDKENPYGIRDIYAKKYTWSIKKVIELLNNVPFTLFGELVSKETEDGIVYLNGSTESIIVFYDLYLNKNWMNWDDFSRIMKKTKLTTPPILYKGIFDFDKIRQTTRINSPFSNLDNQPIEGLIVKTKFEDNTTYSRDIGKIENIIFKTVKSLPSPETIEKHPSMIAHKIVESFLSDDDADVYWSYFLEESGLTYTKENQGEVLRTLVMETLSFMEDDIAIEAASNLMNILEIKKEIKKILPGRIMRSIKPVDNGK